MPRLIRLTIGAGRFLIPLCPPSPQKCTAAASLLSLRKHWLQCHVQHGLQLIGQLPLVSLGESDLMLRRVNGWDPEVQSA